MSMPVAAYAYVASIDAATGWNQHRLQPASCFLRPETWFRLPLHEVLSDLLLEGHHRLPQLV